MQVYSAVTLPFLVVLLLKASLTACEQDGHGEINIYQIKETCPSIAGHQSNNVTSCMEAESLSPCTEDHQCKIGSKCCALPGCSGNQYCIDLTSGLITEPKPSEAVSPKRRWGLQVVRRCVECACVFSCRTDSDCKRGRRRRCYRNACSSYCIRG